MTKVLILAGGEGTRLWPLTGVRPKPTVYMGGPKRILEYVADCFVQADYSHLYIAVEHMDRNIIEAFGDGSNFVYDIDNELVSLKITYTRAPPGKQFRGTADALRRSRVYLADRVIVTDRETQRELEVTAEEYLRNKQKLRYKRFVDGFDTVIVGSGDVLTNLNMSELVRDHKQRGTIATIATYKVEDVNRIVNELGTVLVGNDGKVLGFREKPKTQKEVESDMINAGIYVFDVSILDWLDRHDDVADFGKHLFPELLREGEGIYAHVIPGYWNDIGTIENYRNTNLHLIEGIDGVDIGSHIQRPQKASRILGQPRHSLIAQGCRIEPEAVVVNSVVGNDVTVEDYAHIESSVIFPESFIGRNVFCKNVVIDGEVIIEKGAQIGEGVVIGKGTHIKSSAIIHPGMLIAPGETITGRSKKKFQVSNVNDKGP